MPFKTPDFNNALDEILEDLKPHQKTCPQCGRVFDIYSSLKFC
ncbi:MAG: hypothetical protein QME57_01305 [Patescibacteria group bacterium]|nr:hypothetical protein [Patescibacteria group bacterium]